MNVGVCSEPPRMFVFLKYTTCELAAGSQLFVVTYVGVLATELNVECYVFVVYCKCDLLCLFIRFNQIEDVKWVVYSNFLQRFILVSPNRFIDFRCDNYSIEKPKAK